MNASPRSGNPAARYFFLFLLGLVTGAIGTVMAMRAIQARKDPFHEAVMQVMNAHVGLLRQNVRQNRCSATDTPPHLQTLRMMANDIEPAFGQDFSDDQRFVGHASRLRATLDDSLASPPLNCAGAGAALKTIDAACNACHQDYRS